MSIDSFVEFCRNIQPYSEEDITSFFEGIVFFPYDKELLLQSYLFLNVRQVFPSCSALLLFESAVDGSSTNEGKCDFVFLKKQNSLLFVETKYIDTMITGGTASVRRTKHRQKVLKQVKEIRDSFIQRYQIAVEQTECAVFTTDKLLIDRANSSGVDAKSISIAELEQWRENKRNEVLGRSF